MLKQFLARRWFLVALVLTFALGVSCRDALAGAAAAQSLRYGIVAAVLFLMALPLQAGAMWQALRRPWAPLLAVGINLGLLPLVAWPISQVLSAEFGPGFLVAAVAPCTLASASVWTRRAGGNDAVSILVTVITNLACFVVTPLWLFTIMRLAPAGDAGNAISLGAMVNKLALLVVTPMAAAQIVRLYRPMGRWAAENKLALGVGAQCGILAMVLLGAVQTALRLRDAEGTFLLGVDAAVMILAVLGLHIAMFFTGLGLSRILRMPREDRIAVGFAGSQKTLMVGLQVAMESGFSILPMVAYHLGQLFVDTILADWLRGGEARSSDDKREQAEECSPPPIKSDSP